MTFKIKNNQKGTYNNYNNNNINNNSDVEADIRVWAHMSSASDALYCADL